MPNSYNYYTNKNQYKTINYKKKLKGLKKLINNLVVENAALCDQVAQIQENIVVVKEERRFLLKKLYQFEPHSDLEISNKNHSHNSSNHGDHKRSKKKLNSDAPDKSSKSRKSNSRMRKKTVQPIPLDATGRPVFPIELTGGLTIHSLGDVITDRMEFHTDEVIYPVGYVSTRVYGSLKDPRIKCVYTCKITDNGVPRFNITADNDLDAPIIGSNPDVCHSLLLQHINEALQMDVVHIRSRGNEFFGLSHPTILNLIQSSPGTRKCANYKWTKFEVGRNPDVIDENEPTLNYEALQRAINLNTYKNVAKIKDEPPDGIMDTARSLTDLLMS